MVYDSEIHHRRSIRIKGYDYSQDGAYFVTVCAQNRRCLFGEITDGKMVLNEAGRMVCDCWYEIPKHYPFVILDEFVAMPNHIHGIIIIQNRERERANNYSPLQIQNAGTSKTVGAIIRGYKIGVTKLMGKSVWQRNYWEHIVRDDDDLDRVREYIINNPINWEVDELYFRIP